MRNRFVWSVLPLLLIFAPALWYATRSQAAKTQAAAPADFTGVWARSRRPPDRARKYTNFEIVMTLPGEPPRMTPWGEARFNGAKPQMGPRAIPSAQSNDPVYKKCFPPGVPRIYLERAGPFEIMQIPGRVVMIFEYDHFVREIYTDGRPHSDVGPTWMGDSIGRWEGDTLVVDTTSFNDKTWLDLVGHPHSDALHLVERFRRVDANTLVNDLTIDDPKAYTKPWEGRMIFERKPGWTLGETVCEDNFNFDEFEKKQ